MTDNCSSVGHDWREMPRPSFPGHRHLTCQRCATRGVVIMPRASQGPYDVAWVERRGEPVCLTARDPIITRI